MKSKHLLKATFAVAILCTLFITSCSEGEEEIASLIGIWEVNTIDASADFDEEQFVASLIEQGLSEDDANELLVAFGDNSIEVGDLNQNSVIYEFAEDNTYIFRIEPINEDYPDQEQNGTYVFNRSTRELTLSPVDDPISNDPATYTVETLNQNNLVLDGNFEFVSGIGIDEIDLEVPFTITTSISMTRL